MANRMSSAGSSTSLPGTGCSLVSTWTRWSFCTRPLLPEKPVVETEYSTLAPSAWLEDTRSFNGQCGHDSALFSRLGGIGLFWGGLRDFAHCRKEVPMEA